MAHGTPDQADRGYTCGMGTIAVVSRAGRRYVIGACFVAVALTSQLIAAPAKPQAAEKEAAPYRVNHDAPLDAKEQLVANENDHTQYRVEFNGIQGDRVPAFLYIPKDGKAKHPA